MLACPRSAAAGIQAGDCEEYTSWNRSMLSVKRKLSNDFRRKNSLLYWMLVLMLLASCGPLTPLSPPTPTATPSDTLMPTAVQTATPSVTPTPTLRPAVCGGPREMFILLIGSDARRDTYTAGLADSTRLVRVDFVDPGIQVISFPRDLYVEIPGIEESSGITHGKLNQAYLYGNPGYKYYQGEGQGPGLMAETLEHNFGARVDHYVAINLQTFVRIVDALGGIDLTLPYTVDGRVGGSRDPNRYFAAGNQHLNGYRTMLLARMRPGGDLQRIEVQNLILQAFAEKLFSPSAIMQMPTLLDAFLEAVQTDLGPAEIGQLLCLRTWLETDDVDFGSFPEGLFKSGRVRDPVLGNTSILEADFDVLRTYIESFNKGEWPRLIDDPLDQAVP